MVRIKNLFLFTLFSFSLSLSSIFIELLFSQYSQKGTVFAGKCRGLTVAIKKLKVETLDPETLEDFRKEVSVLRYIGSGAPLWG